MSHNYRWRRAAGARRRRLGRTTSAVALLVVFVAVVTGCGASSTPAPTTAAEAYASAHPTGGLPSSLHATDLSREKLGRLVAGIVGDDVRIVLPVRLPPGFWPAAPYISVGDGTARPNPEGWGGSYRVSYTDGQGLLVMTYGAADLPDGVVWSQDRFRMNGRAARVGRAEGALVVATIEHRPLIVIMGWNVTRTWMLESAGSVASWR